MTAYRRSPDAVAQRVGDDLVLVHLDSNRMFAANETAARIWEALESNADLAALREELAVAGGARVENDIAALIAELEKEGLIERVE